MLRSDWSKRRARNIQRSHINPCRFHIGPVCRASLKGSKGSKSNLLQISSVSGVPLFGASFFYFFIFFLFFLLITQSGRRLFRFSCIICVEMTMPMRTGLFLLILLNASAYELDQNESFSPRRARFSANSPCK